MRFLKLHTEPLLAIIALGLTLLMLASIRVEMSDATQMTLLGLFTLAVLAYSALIFRENPADERENELSLIAGKYAYVVGSTVLSIGIVVQTIAHDIDPWLLIVLASMVVSKSLVYFIRK